MSYPELKNLFEEHSLLNDIGGILNWDMATHMPKNSRGQRIKQIKKLYDYKEKIFMEIKNNDLFKKIQENKLNKKDSLNLELMKEKFLYFSLISKDRLKKKAELSIECEGLWREAKEKSNFNLVKSSLVKLIELVKEESCILSEAKEKKKYDCLLEKYDRSLDTENLIKIFTKVEKFIKNQLPAIEKKQKNLSFETKENLTEEEQFTLSKIFMKKLGFDFSRGRIDKSSHPFCGGSSDDIRITTRFTEGDSFSCFDALMHETGHALYEQGLPKDWIYQPLGSAGGMSLHESQSIFIEMQIIKSLPVSRYLKKVLKNDIGKNSNFWKNLDLFEIRSKVEKNFIRVDSDEVHYPLHILHRFNIEYKIIEENEKIENLPDIWNQEFSRIFDKDIIDDSNGCLQDIHWFTGDFGYFPTYSIGAFIAAQLAHSIKEQITDYNDYLENGNFTPILEWLRKNVHEKGSSLKINELLLETSGQTLNTMYFEKHIVNRYIHGNF